MQADGPRGCRFAGQWFPESQSWHPSVPPFGEMSCITCRCGVSGGLCEVGVVDLAWGSGTSQGGQAPGGRASPRRLKVTVPWHLWGPSGSGLSCTRQGCPTVSGMTVHHHCPAAQGRRAAAAPTAHPGGGVSAGPGSLGRGGSTGHVPGAVPSAAQVWSCPLPQQPCRLGLHCLFFTKEFADPQRDQATRLKSHSWCVLTCFKNSDLSEIRTGKLHCVLCVPPPPCSSSKLHSLLSPSSPRDQDSPRAWERR